MLRPITPLRLATPWVLQLPACYFTPQQPAEKLIQSEPTTSLTLSLLGVSNLVACVMVAVIALAH